MNAGEHLRQAFESLAENPRRALAASIGVFWGAAAILVMLAWGTGFRRYMDDEFSRYGRRMVFVIPGVTSSGFPGHRAGVPIGSTRRDGLAAERENSELVEAVLTEHWGQERVLVEVSGRVRRLDLTASDQRFAYYRRFELAAGRFFGAPDVERANAVAVLGWEAARDLFPDPTAAIGRTIRVSGVPFELVGVFDPKSGRQYMNTNRPDNRLLVIPVSTAEARLGFAQDEQRVFMVYPRAGVSGDAALHGVATSLARRSNFHPDDGDALRHFDLSDVFAMLDLFQTGFTIFIGVAGTIALLVGGIGIANYHLALLAEREVELAVARALGARRRTLVVQCVLESLLVSGAAAVLGVAAGLGGCALLGWLAPPEVLPAPVLSPTAVVITGAALFGVALVAALVPALRVRRTDVALALRAEVTQG